MWLLAMLDYDTIVPLVVLFGMFLMTGFAISDLRDRIDALEKKLKDKSPE